MTDRLPPLALATRLEGAVILDDQDNMLIVSGDILEQAAQTIRDLVQQMESSDTATPDKPNDAKYRCDICGRLSCGVYS